jgi:hypothetical protein
LAFALYQEDFNGFYPCGTDRYDWSWDANWCWDEKMSYLEFPMLIKVSIPLNYVKPYFTAGPTLGIQLSASEDITNGGQVIQTNDANTAWETIDFGLYFGGGLDFHVANNIDVFTGFGYNLGLTNVSKIQGIEGKNSGIQITGGIKFGL